MKKCLRRKRPCCICHKWFSQDVRQQGRQKTCSQTCRKEHHRRQCRQWNKKNKVYQKANYLSAKLDQESHTENTSQPQEVRPRSSPPSSPPSSRLNLNLPQDVICQKIGIIHFIILEYLAEQISQKVPKWVNRVSRERKEPRLLHECF
jgi:hypothetical protein